MRSIFTSNNFKTMLLVIFSNIVTIVNLILDWPLIKFANMRVPGYTDSNVLESVKCFSEGLDVYSTDFHTSDCVYAYGSAFLIIGKVFGLNGGMRHQVSLIFALMVSSIIAVVLGKYLQDKFSIKYIYVLMTVASPATSFLFERGNFDQLVFILVFLAAISHSNQLRVLSLLIITFTAMFKYYTFPLLIFYILINRRILNRLFMLTIPIFTLTLIYIDWNRTTFRPATGGCCQFGGASFSYYFRFFGMTGNQGIWILLSSILMGIFALIILKLPKVLVPLLETSRNFKSNSINPFEIFIEWSGLILITTWFLGFNYDYRLIYFTIAGLVVINLKSKNKVISTLWILCYLVSLWATVGLGSALVGNNILLQTIMACIQLIGDISIFFMVAYLTSFYLLLMKNNLLHKKYFSNFGLFLKK